MKNKYMTFVALAAAALATSCTTDDLAGQQQIQNQSSSQTVTLTASVDDDNTTRTGMTKDENDKSKAKFYWHNGDAISVLTVNGTSYENTKFTTADADGTTKAKFTGKGEPYFVALYPYNKDHKFKGATSTYNLPATYTYNKVDGNIFYTEGSTSYSSNSTNMPMYGTITNGSISFNHLGGLAVIRIDQMPASSGTLTVTADQQLSGDFEINLKKRSIATTSTGVDADKKVTFDFKGANENKVGVFYLPLATGEYTNVEIVLNCGIVNQTINFEKLSVDRADVTAIPVVANKVINGHVFVDLGLSVLWAEANIGAKSAADYGNYYDSYASGAADCKKWDSSCSVPDDDSQFGELYDCDSEWTTQANSNNEKIWGLKLTSKTNGNSIFLPAAGYIQHSIGQKQGQGGYYWLSSSEDLICNFDNQGLYCAGANAQSYPVRPVAKK